ncbi:MAG TPA: filamentous hemagglutinin N-terminal domain-containing protein [Burkholderiales bacterium]|nr:filamentous hemagglutinin N-terminal domain-containing protein [Burkholderiales bacterium]
MSLSARARVPYAVNPGKSSLRQAVIAALAAMQYAAAGPAMLGATAARANPVGEKVIAGSATFNRSGNALTVNQGTDRAIINWQGFSIGAGELTKFVQPNAASAVLNRVVSGDPSRLLGRLEANGKVFLINPNGILVGGGAVINTNSFIASTRDVSNAQFMAGGDLKFVGDSKASIQNLGSIKADGGDVFLIAHSVDNAGTIEAPKGTVGLAAGTEVLLKHAGDERLFVQTTVPASADTGVSNSGLISAVQAELKAAGGNVYALAVNNSGAIHATGIVEKDGRVLLTATGGNVSNSGTITARNADGSGGSVRISAGHNDAAPATAINTGTISVAAVEPGATGGAVEITGDRVGLMGNARVDASGDAGGGTVLVGGDFQGKNPLVDNADVTLIGKDARISADAVTSGDGGRVIVWADGATEFRGSISARGGANSGDGGFAEVSGKASLGFAGRVDLSAPRGARGTLLLDPHNARAQTGGTATPDQVDDFSDSPDQDRTIDPLLLAATNADVDIRANNDIFFDSPFALTAPGASLRAIAGRNILIADVPISTNNGAIFLNANNPAADQTNRDGGAGVIVMQNNAVISSGNADVTLRLEPSPDPLNTSQFITVAQINAGTGTITLTNRGANSAPQNGTIAQVGNGLTAARLIVEAPGQVLLQSPTNNVGQVLLDTRRQFLFVNAGTLFVGGTSPTTGFGVGAGDVSIRALTGDLTNNAPGILTAGGGGGTVTFDAAAGSLRMNDAPRGGANLFAPSNVDAVFTAANDVRILAPNVRARNLTVIATNGSISFETPAGASNFGVIAQDIAPNGMVRLTANGNVTSTGTSTITARTLNVTSNNGMIDLDGVVNAGSLAASAAGNINIDRPTGNAIQALGAVSSGGDITIRDVDNIALGLQITGLTRTTKADGRIDIATNGNVQFLPSANCRIETGPNGTIVFDAMTGQILDGTTPSFVGESLFIAARAIGGGTTNPLNTQVQRLGARATRSGGFGGFAYFTNNLDAAPGALSIARVDPATFGIAVDGFDAFGRALHLTNNGSTLLDAGVIAATGALGSVTLNAMGADSDVITSAGFNGAAVNAENGIVTVNARDVTLGSLTGIGDLQGDHVNVFARRNVRLGGRSKISADGNVLVSAADSITMRSDASGGSVIRSLGDGVVQLTADTVDLENGINTGPVVMSRNGGAGNIIFSTDTINLLNRVDAGTGRVAIAPRTANRPITIGPERPGTLTILDAELDRITAGTLQIGSFDGTTGQMLSVDSPITRPATGPTYGTLDLRTVDNIALGSDITLGGGNLRVEAGNNVQGGARIDGADLMFISNGNTIGLTGDITATNLTLNTPTGSITLTDDVSAGTFTADAPRGNIRVDGSRNNIVTLARASYDREFRLHDSQGGLIVNGFVDGGALAAATLEVRGGNLVLQQGAKFFFGGRDGGIPQELRLFSDTGFINQAGPDVLVPENGGRWLIYTPSSAVTDLGGLQPAFTLSNVAYPERPVNAGNGVVFATSPPPPPVDAPAPPPDFTPVRRLFAADSGGLSPVERLMDQILDVGNVKFDIAGGASTLAALDAMADFFEFRDAQYEAGVARLRSLNLERYQRDQVDSAVAIVDYKVIAANHAYQEFLEGKTSFSAFRSAAREALDAVKILERVHDDFSGARARREIEQAASAVIAEASAFAMGTLVPDDNQVPIVVPGGIYTPTIYENGVPMINSIFVLRHYGYSLDKPVSDVQMSDMAKASGGHLSFEEVSRIVAAGGGNLTPGVVAGLVAAGGGNLSGDQMAGIVAAGGGNLRDPLTLQSVLNATLVAAGAGNIVAAGAGNIVAAGAGNIVAAGGGNMVAAGGMNLVAAGGLNLIGADGASLVGPDGASLVGPDGASLVAAGGLNLTSRAISSLVAAGGLNLAPGAVAQIVAAGAGNLVAAGGGNIVAAGAGNIVAAGAGNFQSISAGLVAAGGGNISADRAASIVAAGAGNFNSTVASLVAAGAGNLAQMANMVAGRQANLISGAGLSTGGIANLVPSISAGSGLVGLGGAGAASLLPNQGGGFFPGFQGGR